MRQIYRSIYADKNGKTPWLKVESDNKVNSTLNLLINKSKAVVTVEMLISPFIDESRVFTHEILTNGTENTPSTINYPISYIRLSIENLKYDSVMLEMRSVT